MSMSEGEFYDEDWKRLLRQQPFIARKIEALRCETVSYEEFNELRERVQRLEKKVPLEPEDEDKEEFNGLFWEELQGAKGSFERTSKKANNNSQLFQALQATLKRKKGFCYIGDYMYWFDNNDPDVIDRRKK